VRSEIVTTLLALMPLIAAFAALLAGHYPGERVIGRMRGRRPRRSPRRLGLGFSSEARGCYHGICLLSCGLAGRAPPPVVC
jgi:hypothetical protein